MKRVLIISVLIGSLAKSVQGQEALDSILTNVERNNTTLSAFRKSIDAKKIGNKTGLTPQNPEVEFNYLWGNPSAIGNRTDFSIRQSFDFPSAYIYKNQISNLKNLQAELEYLKLRKEILFQARIVCADLQYYNSLYIEFSNRLVNAKQLATVGKAKFEIGETGILDYNKSQMYYLNTSKAFEKVEMERKALQLELIRLNGGIAIEYNQTISYMQGVTPDFEQWHALAEQNNPMLQWVKAEIVLGGKQTKLAVSQSLPKFYAGYMSEKVAGQQFQGVTFGITIPLWENKNAVKLANTSTLAFQLIETDAKLQFYNEMKALYEKVISLQNTVADYRNKLSSLSNTELLQKALEKGEISLAEYFFELSLYYESVEMYLEMQHDLIKAHAELQKYY
jgi:hypothetical protein